MTAQVATRLPSRTKPHLLVARYLRNQIASSGLTQRQVADGIGMDQPWLSRHLTGATPFTIDDVAMLVQYLRLDYRDVTARIMQMADHDANKTGADRGASVAGNAAKRSSVWR